MANYPIIYRYSSPRRRTAQPSRGYSIFDHMQREMSDMFNRAQSMIDDDERRDESFFSPAIDSHESDSDYRMSVELPGVKREDLDVSIENGQIRISGEKKSRYESSENGRTESETRYGQFSRVIGLPENIDEDAIEASFEDGVLEITVPKASVEEPKSRKLDISTSHRTLETESGKSSASSEADENASERKAA